MASSAPTSGLRQILDDRFSELLREVQALVDGEVASSSVEARERGRRETAEQLNQAVRRMAQAPDAEELRATLVDAAGAFAGGVALFRVEGATARGEATHGVEEEAAERLRGLEIPLASAAALAGAVETRDPVATATAPGEVSPEVAGLLGQTPEGRAWVFPVAPGGRVAALLYAWGAVEGPPIELLAQAAAGVWSGLAAQGAPELVAIAPAKPASGWDSLSAGEQQIHLHAQRFARVRVAEMRLYMAAAVQKGRTRRDLYGALRQPIDAARAIFREKFFAACLSMVDYLHLELLRTLANEDGELLGKEYPGPMA